MKNNTKLQKILVITTGGTISCVQTPNGLAPSLDGKSLLAKLPESISKQCDVLEILKIDSSDITPKNMIEIAKAVRKNFDLYSGFVITHGTDTLSYTAAVLSYLIQNSSKPVVLTGSMLTFDDKGSDAFKNLLNSICYAMDENSCGVCVCFNSKILAATHVKKVHTQSIDAIKSINFPPVAAVDGFEISRFIDVQISGKPVFFDKLDTNVAVFSALPNLKFDDVSDYLSKFKALIILGYGMGGLPTTGFAKGLAKLANDGKIIVLATQTENGFCDYSAYAVGKQFEKTPLKWYKSMTVHALWAKLMWAVANSKSNDEIYQRLEQTINFDNCEVNK